MWEERGKESGSSVLSTTPFLKTGKKRKERVIKIAQNRQEKDVKEIRW